MGITIGKWKLYLQHQDCNSALIKINDRLKQFAYNTRLPRITRSMSGKSTQGDLSMISEKSFTNRSMPPPTPPGYRPRFYYNKSQLYKIYTYMINKFQLHDPNILCYTLTTAIFIKLEYVSYFAYANCIDLLHF